MADLKVLATHAFKSKDYTTALSHYTTLIASTPALSSKDLSILHANKSACHLHLKNPIQAIQDAKRSIEHDPLYAKAHYRLAAAILEFGESEVEVVDEEVKRDVDPALGRAKVAAACAVALLGKGAKEGDPAVEVFTRSWGKAWWRSVLLCSTQGMVEEALRGKSSEEKMIVLAPGQYHLPYRLHQPFTLIGLGSTITTILGMPGSHAAYINSSIALYNLTFKMQPPLLLSAICVDGPTSTLHITDCKIADIPNECGLLVHGGTAVVAGCLFEETGKQAIEVRQGGRLEMRYTVIRKCGQGISAYGGARRVFIDRCRIERSKNEGVLAVGSQQNAPTRAQSMFERPLTEVTAQAHEWGLKNSTDLDVVILRSEIKENGTFGLSLDAGSNVTVRNSVIRQTSTNDAILVKGETNLTVSASQIFHGRQSDGVHVGINYGGNVILTQTCFIGSPKRAIVDEITVARSARMILPGVFWSKPVVEIECEKVESVRRATSLSELQRLFEKNVKISSPDVKKKVVEVDHAISSSLTGLYAPSRCIVSFADAHYYAIGNIPGHDLTRDIALTTETSLNIFLGACGDVRNVLKTAQCAASRGPAPQLRFVLNDINPSILMRNLILLHLIASSSTSVEDIAAVWANHELTKKQRQMVEGACDVFLGETWPSWVGFLNGTDEGTWERICECFKAVRSFTVGVEDLRKVRMTGKAQVEENAMLTLNAIGGFKEGMKVMNEVKGYIETGNLCSDRGVSVNPTLYEAPMMQYRLYWSSSIYRAVDISGSQGTAKTSLYKRLIRVLEEQVRATRRGLSEGTIKIDLMLGDVLACLLSPVSSFAPTPLQPPNTSTDEERFFDVIDCSNVIDYVSLPSILLALPSIINPSKGATIYLQAMRIAQLLHSSKPILEEALMGLSSTTFHECTNMRPTLIASLCTSSRPSIKPLKWIHEAPSQILSTPCSLVAEILENRKRLFGVRSQLHASSTTMVPSMIVSFVGGETVVDFVNKFLDLAGKDPVVSLASWELKTHALVQRRRWGGSGGVGDLVTARFKAEMSFQGLMTFDLTVVVLVVTDSPFNSIFSPTTKPRQLIETLQFDKSSGDVSFLTTRCFMDVMKSSWITVCSITADEHHPTLMTLSNSTPIRSLDIIPIEDSSIHSGPNLPTPKFPIDQIRTFLEWRGGWRLLALHETGEFVCCDVGVVGLEGGGQVAVEARGGERVGREMVVRVGKEREFCVDFGVQCRFGKGAVVRVCRGGGFICVKAPKV
ncbi:Zinc finger CCCH domain-containing protein 7A [Dinochytrium kinnereticum]|nr:Zinc finger CCCH domain-containing protein 7A [Dinochytrium kinnereticum]